MFNKKIMKEFLNRLFGGSSVDYKELIDKGAIILDVRTPSEYRSGHIKNAQNIPLGELSGKLRFIENEVPIITCCRSGMRSASAKSILLQNGFTEVFNGGGWESLNKKIELN